MNSYERLFYAFDMFLWCYVKDHVYSQWANMLDEIKARITAPIAFVTKDTLQRLGQEVDCTLDVSRNKMVLIVYCFISNSFYAYI
jgi:hypothetical protein